MHEFLNAGSVGQLAVTVLLVYSVWAALRAVTGWRSRWLPFGLSLAVAVLVAGAAGALALPAPAAFPEKAFFLPIQAWFLALVHGCVAFSIVTGAGGRAAKARLQATIGRLSDFVAIVRAGTQRLAAAPDRPVVAIVPADSTGAATDGRRPATPTER